MALITVVLFVYNRKYTKSRKQPFWRYLKLKEGKKVKNTNSNIDISSNKLLEIIEEILEESKKEK